MLENELKQCVYLDTNSNSSRWSLSKFLLHEQIFGWLSTECLNDTHMRILDDIASACGVP